MVYNNKYKHWNTKTKQNLFTQKSGLYKVICARFGLLAFKIDKKSNKIKKQLVFEALYLQQQKQEL